MSVLSSTPRGSVPPGFCRLGPKFGKICCQLHKHRKRSANRSLHPCTGKGVRLRSKQKMRGCMEHYLELGGRFRQHRIQDECRILPQKVGGKWGLKWSGSKNHPTLFFHFSFFLSFFSEPNGPISCFYRAPNTYNFKHFLAIVVLRQLPHEKQKQLADPRDDGLLNLPHEREGGGGGEKRK